MIAWILVIISLGSFMCGFWLQTLKEWETITGPLFIMGCIFAYFAILIEVKII